VYNTFWKTYYTRIIRIIQPTFQKFIKHSSIIVMRPQQWIQLTFVHCIKQNVLYTYYTYYTAHISKIHKTQFNSPAPIGTRTGTIALDPTSGTVFTLGEPVSLVKVFRLFRLEWIVLVFRVWTQHMYNILCIAGPACLWCPLLGRFFVWLLPTRIEPTKLQGSRTLVNTSNLLPNIYGNNTIYWMCFIIYLSPWNFEHP
jgi:hypothetical protein